MPLWLLSKLHHVSESPFPFLWDANKNISFLPHKATLKSQTRKCTRKHLGICELVLQRAPSLSGVGCPVLGVMCPPAVERGLEEGQGQGPGWARERRQWVMDEQCGGLVGCVGCELRGA